MDSNSSNNSSFSQNGFSQFPFPLEFQKKILIRLFRDYTFASEIVPELNPKVFPNTYFQILALCLSEYFIQYRRLLDPADSLNLVSKYLERDSRLDPVQFASLLHEIYSTPLEDEDPYLKDETRAFFKMQKVLKSLDEARKLVVSERRYEDALRTVSRACNYDGMDVLFLDHRETLRKRISELNVRQSRLVPTVVVPELDRLMDGGLGIKELMVVLAPTGKGKTRILVNFARGALMKNLNVLYVTTETSGEIIALRLDSSISKMTRSDLRKDPEKGIRMVEDHYARFGGRLIIAEVPPYRFSVPSLYWMIDQIGRAHV